MPWKCPACTTSIRLALVIAGDDHPRPGRVYRCSVCHLELVLSEVTGALIPVPLLSESSDVTTDAKP